MRGFSASVSMQHAQGTLLPYPLLQALNLSPGQAQYLDCLPGGHLLF